jgi:hypothetical protein
MQTQTEQRSSPRVSVKIPVKLSTAVEAVCLGEIVSLNENGFLCSAGKSLQADTEVRLIMLIPSTTPDRERQSSVISGEGVVVRENILENTKGDLDHTVAVRFTRLAGEGPDLLKRFIRYCMENHMN